MSRPGAKPGEVAQWVRVISPERLFTALLIIIHLSLLPGVYVAVRIGRPRFLGLSLYLVAGVLLFDVLVVVTRDTEPLLRFPNLSSLTSLLDWRTMLVTLLLSASVTLLRGPGLVLYAMLTVLFTLLMFKALTRPNPSPWFGTMLLLTGSGAALAISSQVLTHEFYLSTSDALRHTAIVSNIVESGSLDAFKETRYWGFLVFHALSAVGVLTTGIAPRTLVALSTIILFQGALLAITVSIRRWTDSTRLALTAGILVASSVPFLEWGTKAHYQSLSFVFFAFILLSFTIHFSDRRAAIPTTIISVAWLATHHLSVAMALFLTGLPVATATALTVLNRRYHPHAVLYIIFVVTFISYWTIITNEIATPFQWIFIHSPPASVGLPTTQLYIQLYDSVLALVGASIPILISYIYFVFWLAVAFLGLLYLIRDGQLRDRRWLILFAGFAASATFYFPNPLWIPLQGIATLFRWGIMAVPLLVIVPAYGLVRAVEEVNVTSGRGAVVVLFVALLVFSSIGSAMTSPSLGDIAGMDRANQAYLSNADLEAISFTESFSTETQSIYGTSFVQGYLYYKKWESDPGYYTDRYGRMTVTGPSGRVIVKSGLSIFQVRSYRENKIKLRIKVDSKYYEKVSVIHAPVGNEDISWNPERHGLVYTNGDTVIQYKP